MMTCSDAIRLIGRATEGAVSPNALDALLEHLERCDACRTEAEDQVLVKRVLASRPEEPVPDGLAAAIATRLDDEGPIASGSFINWRKLTLRCLPVAAMLALAAAVSHRAGAREALNETAALWHQYVYARQIPLSGPEVTDEQVFALLLLNDGAGVDEGER